MLAAVIAIAVIFTREQEKPVSEGSIYITEAVDNGMAGDSYISFDYVPEPAEPVEGERYGYVFHLWCSFIGSDGYQDWLTGYWELDGDTLTLTAFWEDGATTYLDGAESGVAKVYNAEDGKFYIAVEIGGQGVKTITLDPAADKVGEVTDDEGNEGEEGETPVAPMLTMTATGSSGYVNANAKLELFAESQMNGTWKLSIDFGTGDYVEQASGTYALNMTTYDLDLTVTTGAQYINNVQTFSVATNGGTNYTCTVVSTAAGEITLDFTGTLTQA